MTADVAVSLSLLAGIVALSDATRRLLSRALADTGLSVYAVELVSTFQLCCCTHELKLLSEVGGIETRLALTLTYLASVVHGLTFSGAIGNPSGTLEQAYRTRISGGCALRRIACQFAAAVAAKAAVPVIWGFGLSGLHVRHKLNDYRCMSPIHAPLLEAAAVELACAFAVQTAITHTRSVEEKYRVHAVAAVIATVVYAGGSVTGAVFNPALAFSTQFRCSGNSFLEYSLVYWLSPLLELLHIVAPSRSLRSSSSIHLTVPPARLVTMGTRSFSRSAPQLWNSLPPDLRNIDSLPLFKTRLKTHLFQLAYL